MFLQVDWSKALHVLLNTILCSIPEEIFLVVFTLILLNQFDYLQSKVEGENRIKQDDILRITSIVISFAVFSGVLKFYTSTDDIMRLFLLIVTKFLIIMILFKYYLSLAEMVKTFISTLLSYIILVVVETAYIPIVLGILNKTVDEVNYSILTNFLLSLPGRLIEYLLIYYLFLKKVTILKGNILQILFNNKYLAAITVFFVSINIFGLFYLSKIISFEEFLINKSLIIQILIVIFSLLIPIINIIIYISVIYNIKNKEFNNNVFLKNTINAVINDIKKNSLLQKYETIYTTITDLEEIIKNGYLYYNKRK